MSDRASPRSHDAAGGMESRAGGACALGEVGWTFESVASYNVTKCDMRRSMCRSDVSVDRRPQKTTLIYTGTRTTLGADPVGGDRASKPGGPPSVLPPARRQGLHD